jgi:hypothetical protein
MSLGRTFSFFFSNILLVLRNCWVRGIAPPGVAGQFAQRGHVPFGLKEGRDCCTTSRRFGSEEEKRKKSSSTSATISVTVCAQKNFSRLRVSLSPLQKCFGTVWCGVLPHPARLDSLPSAGMSPLDYKRGVPVARPQGGLRSEDGRRQKGTKLVKRASAVPSAIARTQQTICPLHHHHHSPPPPF